MTNTLRSRARLVAAPLAAAALAFAAVAATAQPAASPVGLWKNIDDETKQPKALIRIVDNNGVLSGKIEKILTEKTDAVCDKCTDARKDKPVLGMTILEGLKRNATEADLFDGGHILDPNNGKVYRSQMRLSDGGRKLDVRGYIGLPLLGRTQTWLREE